MLIRYGGDEFAVLLPQVDEKTALAIAERVRLAVCGDTDDISDSMLKIPIRISMGVAERREKSSLERLLRDADDALYRAKRAGRNTVSN